MCPASADRLDGDVQSAAVGHGKTIAAVQSSYIPWKGTFDLINSVDEFFLLDDVQYTTRDWRNRNLLKTSLGPRWLTIPVAVKGKRHQRICDATVAEPGWNRRHWQTITHWYGRARFFRAYAELFEELYLGCAEERLNAINRRFLDAICDLLGITTRIRWSMELAPRPGKTARLVDLCRAAGAERYLSGPLARSYLDEAQFEAAGIEVCYFDFSGYAEYEQLYPPFCHHVSIVDLIFNTGSQAPSYLKSPIAEPAP